MLNTWDHTGLCKIKLTGPVRDLSHTTLSDDGIGGLPQTCVIAHFRREANLLGGYT